MAVNFGRYNAPGILTESIPGPVLGAYGVDSSTVALVGDTARVRTYTTTTNFPTTTPYAIKLPVMSGIKTSTLTVVDPRTGQAFLQSTDYTIQQDNGALMVLRVKSGNILDGAAVTISVKWVPENFFEPTEFLGYSEVVTAYGKPIDVSGAIVSPLTLAARFAFLNGATRVLCVPVKTSSSTPTTREFETALESITYDPTVGIVVPVTGSVTVLKKFRDLVESASAEGYERRMVCGLDGVSSTVSYSDRMQTAKALYSERVALVSPSSIYYRNDDDSLTLCGGQYLAACVAGLASTLKPSTPLTRKFPRGIDSLAESVAPAHMNMEATSGVMVVEQSSAGLIRIRHGITTNPSQIAKREWTITGQQDELAKRIRNQLDNDSIIGSVIDDLTLASVKGSVDAALMSLVTDGTILSYQDLAVRQLPEVPDTVHVKFSWRASVPLNLIFVQYAISLSSGDIVNS